MVERAEGWRASLDYSTDLFSRESADRMLGHFKRLHEDIVAHPDDPLDQLEILTDDEQATLEQFASGETSDYPRDADIGGLFLQTAHDHPDRIALVSGSREVTYQQLRTEVTCLARTLLGLALFLVFVVMAVQYESIRNPLVIMTSVPFCTIGVVFGLDAYSMPISMPVWLGLILLAGIVVNNAIIVVEFIELHRARGLALRDAIVIGARLRLRPVLMTTLTTVVGMLPLALALGDGTEMLQPLAVTIVFGLSFSVLVSLFLVPAIYRMVNFRSA